MAQSVHPLAELLQRGELMLSTWKVLCLQVPFSWRAGCRTACASSSHCCYVFNNGCWLLR